jgi:glycerol-3-phosphate O-acyltransferase
MVKNVLKAYTNLK